MVCPPFFWRSHSGRYKPGIIVPNFRINHKKHLARSPAYRLPPFLIIGTIVVMPLDAAGIIKDKLRIIKEYTMIPDILRSLYRVPKICHTAAL
jgi:hypothetical protein